MAGRPLPAEFDLIARYFAPLATAAPGALGLIDDVALIEPPAGEQLVVTADALVAGVHFLAADPPGLVARKMLRVNLSDLAGKGARPLGYLMTCALPRDLDADWLAHFVDGLAIDQREFGISLLGGDTTVTPGPVTLSVTAIGSVRKGRVPLRAAASVGDAVVISGTLGDAALGLDVQRQAIAGLDADAIGFLIDRYRLPQPRLRLGRALVDAGLLHACIDVSDGLLADLGHICRASGVGAELERGKLPLSAAALAVLAQSPGLEERVVAGGDDYEILGTVAAADLAAALKIATHVGVPLTPIGHIVSGHGVRLRGADGRELQFIRAGYRHF